MSNAPAPWRSLECAVFLFAACSSQGADPKTTPPDPETPKPSRAEPSEEERAPAPLLLVVNKGAASVSFVDLDKSAAVAEVPVGEGPHEVAVSPEGALAVVTNYGVQDAPGSTLSVLDVAEREVVRTIELGEHTRPHGVTWRPDGSEVLVTTEGSKHLLCVDPHAGAITCEVTTDQEISHMVAFAPESARAFVANIGSGSVTAIDTSAQQKLGDVQTGEGAEGIAVSPDESEVWVTNRGADTVSVVDPESLEIEAELESTGFPIRVHSPDERPLVLVTNARAGTLSVFDRKSRELREVVDMEVEVPEPDEERVLGHFEDTSLPIGVISDDGGEHAFVAHALADVVSLVDLDTLKTTKTIEVGTEPDGMAYVPADRQAQR